MSLTLCLICTIVSEPKGAVRTPQFDHDDIGQNLSQLLHFRHAVTDVGLQSGLALSLFVAVGLQMYNAVCLIDNSRRRSVCAIKSSNLKDSGFAS